eukprot:549482_1
MSQANTPQSKTNSNGYSGAMTPGYAYTPSPTSSLPYNTPNGTTKGLFHRFSRKNKKFKLKKQLDLSDGFPYIGAFSGDTENKNETIEIIREGSQNKVISDHDLLIPDDEEEEEEDEEKNQNLSDLKIDINASSNGRKHTKTFSLMENDLKEESEEITEEMTLSLHGYVKEKFIADTLQGAVHVVRKHDSHARYVVKTGDKKLHSQGVTVQKTNGKKYRIEEDIVKEAAMMEKFMTAKHPSALIDFYEFFEDKDKYYLVMGHGGSDMFDFIVSCHDLIISNKLSIREWRRHIKFMFAQMVLFIAWMHKEQNCCNLDISLENLLISDTVNITENEDEFKLNQCYIKFIDFGLSEYFDATMNPCFLCTKFVGKQRYKAPEVYAKKGTFCANKADVWSMGICLFMMAVGAPPFDKPIDEDIAFKYVKLGKINDLLQSW